MSADLSTELAGWDGVCDSLAQVRASHQEFDRFFGQVFDELETLSGQLVRQQDQWRAGKHQSERELRQRAAELDQQRAALAAQLEQLQQAAGRNHGDEAAWAGEQLAQIRQEARQDRAALQEAIETARTQAAELARIVSELGEARAELTEARQDILRHRQELQAQGPTAAALAEDDLQEKLHEADRQRQLLEQERAVLESELEAVRNRAAEMAETLSQQKQQTAQQHEQYSDELRRLRRLLERLSEQLGAPPAGPAADRAVPAEQPAALETGPASPSPVGDAVLDSVMAQFQMLQKDRARRREKAATNG